MNKPYHFEPCSMLENTARRGGEVITSHSAYSGSLNVNFSFNEGGALKNHPVDDFSERASLQRGQNDDEPSAAEVYYNSNYYLNK